METTGSRLTNLSDCELVKLAVEQHQTAFIILYTRYNAGVRSHISRYVAQKEEIEDICLESFQKAFSQLEAYNPEYKFSTWIYRIARNTAFDHLSRHDREKNNMPTTSINEDFAELKELPAVMHNPEEDIITQQEYHTTTWEMILPLDDDMILHVAPASAGAIVTDLAKAFIVPKNTLIKMNAAIWHLAPLPATKDQLTAMIILPECTYANDCTVVDLTAEQQFEIVK